jgi:hypothetical protein
MAAGKNKVGHYLRYIYIFSPFLLVSFNSKPLKGLHVLLRAMVFEAKQKTKNSIKRL